MASTLEATLSLAIAELHWAISNMKRAVTGLTKIKIY